MKGSLVPQEEQQGEPLWKVDGDLSAWQGESAYLEKKDKWWDSQKGGS